MVCGLACVGVGSGAGLRIADSSSSNDTVSRIASGAAGTVVFIVDGAGPDSGFRVYPWALDVIAGLGARWQQLLMFPLLFLFTTTTSALWLTPRELVLSLGPVPVCIFRRRVR